MDENTFASMVQSTKQFALLAETLERNTSASIQQQTQAAQYLQQTVERTNELMQMAVNRSGDQLRQLMQEAIEQTFAPGTQQFDAAVKAVSAQLKQSGDALQKGEADISAKLNKLVWKLQMLAIGSLVVLLCGGILLIFYQTQAYKAAKQRAEAAAIDAEVAEAYRSVHIANCAGRPCVKLDNKAEKWGRNGEFVLLDIDLPKPKEKKE
jgi:Mg2+ and Co2+ transporter CorA